MAIIGIDLGTTNSLACVWKNGKVQMIPNSFGECLTPSIVSIGENGEVFVGKTAKEMLITRPENTFFEFKRHMGTKKQYQAMGKTFRPEELSSFVLRKLKEDAEKFLGEEVTEAVISVPAYFNDDRRAATKNAGLLAGLRVERLVNEPSAVALKHHVNHDEMETFIVFDFGGGTLDVSLVDAFDNMVEIQAVSGDNYLGGSDFNEVIAKDFCKKNNIDWDLADEEERNRFLKEAEQLKIMLSSQNTAKRTFLMDEKEYTMELSNQELIHIAVDIFKRMVKPIKKVMNDTDSTWDDIDKIVLVGGSSKMPVVAQYIRSVCDTEVVVDDSPDESIAIGVGMAAAIKERTGDIKDMILADICPFSLGIEIIGGVFSPIIERNETLPCSRSKIYSTVRDNQEEIEFKFYQGENMIAGENLLLGSLTLSNLPKAPKGTIGVKVTFMYDINGILDIKVDGANQSLHKLILNKNISMSESELKLYMQRLQEMTVQPAEQEQNRYIIEEARRIYQECNPKYRNVIVERLHIFENVMATGTAREIREAYVVFAVFLQMIERNKVEFEEFDENFWAEGFQTDSDDED